jgi:hypothetical protein
VVTIKNRRQTNLFISFRKKVRVQKPKLNYTLENDNTVRIIMSAEVTRGANVLKKKYNSIAFFYLYLCMNFDFIQLIFLLQECIRNIQNRIDKTINRIE